MRDDSNYVCEGREWLSVYFCKIEGNFNKQPLKINGILLTSTYFGAFTVLFILLHVKEGIVERKNIYCTFFCVTKWLTEITLVS